MECSNCGAYNDDKNKVCETCGQPLPEVLPVSKPEKSLTGEKPKKTSHPPVAEAAAQVYQPLPLTAASLTWGLFAGYGKRQSHGGWVVEGESVRASLKEVGIEPAQMTRIFPQ